MHIELYYVQYSVLLHITSIIQHMLVMICIYISVLYVCMYYYVLYYICTIIIILYYIIIIIYYMYYNMCLY